MSACWRSLSLGSCLALAACFNPSGQTTTTEGPGTGTTGGTGAATSTASTDDTTTAPVSTTTATSQSPTTGGTCNLCEAPAPYCTPTGDCVGCDALPEHGMSCGALDPDKPLCDAVAGGGSGLCAACLSPLDCSVGVCHPDLKECVACLGDGDCPPAQTCDLEANTCVACRQDSDCPSETQPICDSGTCRACGEHGECESGACELDVGNCFPLVETHHWYVDAGVGACMDSTCTIEQPCCEISEAFAGLEILAQTYHIVHVAAGTYDIPFELNVSGRRVAVLAAPGAELAADAPGKPLILLGDAIGLQPIDSKLYLSRLRVTGTASVGLSCIDAPYFALDDVVMHDLVGNGVFAGKCTMKARRSELVRNDGGFHIDQNATVRLENSVVAGVTLQPALKVMSNGQLDLLYTTVGLQGGVASGLLYCIDSAQVTIRNSALLAGGLGDYIDCTGALNASYSVTTEADLAGEAVVTVMPNIVPAAFDDWAGSKLLLAGDGAYLKDVARWTTSDPKTDVQGAPRPDVDGAMDVAGADLPGQP